MSRDGSGNYSLYPTGNPVTTNTTISSTWANNTLNDLAAAMTQSVSKDGQTTVTGNIPMGTNKLTGLGAGSAATDSANLGQVAAQAFIWCGTAGGTANALTLAPTPAITAYAAGQVFRFKSSASGNSAATTVAVSGLTTQAIQNQGVALTGGEIETSKWYEVWYDGAAFQLMAVQPGMTSDVTPIANGSSDASKKLRLELDTNITTATTRILTIPSADGTIATTLSASGAPNQSQICSISASVGANALTISASNLTIDFRSATLTSGTVTTINGTPANLVISSGSTLGTINATQSRILIIAMNNAGTIELAAVNASGGNNLTETGVISTTAEGGAGAADSASVIYSTTSRSNLSYRVIGYVESTQATAGTWATTPSTLQGTGGNANTAMSSIGYGQTWQNLTGSRAYSTNYYNTTGRPIMVVVSGINTGAACSLTLNIDGVTASQAAVGTSASGLYAQVSGIVPPGSLYNVSPSNNTLVVWSELR
jgi:hypothetical protein